MENFSVTSTPRHSFNLPVIRANRASTQYIYDDDFEDDPDTLNAPASLYSNLTVVSVTKAAWRDKTTWFGAENEAAPASSSGTFTKLLRTTVRRRPEKMTSEHPESHSVTLNLHQFQSESGESLGEDPEGWARLTF